jgi:phosphorylcholine metabolism protein LicD
MLEEIKTERGIFTYKPVKLFLGRKLLDPIVSKNNLLDFKAIMDKHSIHYGLWFGTLLGAIRENDFIKHDEDTDVFMLEEDREKVVNALFDFEDLGLKVIRYEENVLSFMRDNDYIDIYFYKKSFNQRVMLDNGIDEKYLEKTKDINFLGVNFPVSENPEEALKILYGENWRIPIEGGKAVNISTIHTIKGLLLKIPVLSTIYKKMRA